MIEYVIKRNGERQKFNADKINKWGQWAAETLGDKVDWSGIVMHTNSVLNGTVDSQELQEALIRTCLTEETWSYYLMAGRLYAPYLYKKIFNRSWDDLPPIKEVHRLMQTVGLMRTLDYSDEEYAQINELIDHSRDFQEPHFALHQVRVKYALKNRVTGQEYETPQYTYMRMAMALAENEPAETRMEHLANWYTHFSEKPLSAPTPNYVNLGTSLNGYASCCTYTTYDTAPSLAAGDHIAYMMTVMSAGIGAHINTRSFEDPVRGGVIPHMGRGPYYRALVGAIKANLQNGRGGAATAYYEMFNPDLPTIARYKNPMATEDRKIRGIDYAMCTNKFFARKARNNEDMFTFNVHTAPDLYYAFYSDNWARFEELYHQYEQDPNFKKNYVNAREFLLIALNEAVETGRHYLAWMDEINHHTPFKEPIYSSNLCVAPETKILTSSGYQEIQSVSGTVVDVWNGEEFSTVDVVKTGEDQELITVVMDNGKSLDCTPYHKFYLKDGYGGPVEVRAGNLKPGDGLIDFDVPTTLEAEKPFVSCNGDFQRISLKVKDVFHKGRKDDTYCFTEPKRGMALFNGIPTGQCTETAFPTKPYETVADLYAEEDHGRGEIGLCSLGAVVISRIRDREHHKQVIKYALRMIDKCVHMADYALPHLGVTAKSRINAGVGMMGLAHYLAERGLSYDSEEGLKEIHRIAERHAYLAIEASLELGQELGNAPWMHKTKWPEGWLPIDTYNRSVDTIADFQLEEDWEDLRRRVIANGGIRNSCLINYMPGESSSKAIGETNSIYPIRRKVIVKTDDNNVIRWAAPRSDELEYQSAWDISTMDMIKFYAVVQKFTDQSISADYYRRIQGAGKVKSSELLAEFFAKTKYGHKTSYYSNSLTARGRSLEQETVEDNTQEPDPVQGEETEDGVELVGAGGCGAGGCSL